MSASIQFSLLRAARALVLVAVSLVALMAAMRTANAQRVTGSIVGTVVDGSGAAIRDAKVTITEAGTQVSQSLVTNESGNYTAPNLPPGIYKVTVAINGFSTSEHTGIELFVDSTQRVDVTLNTGTVTETVNVTSKTIPQLQTETADTGRRLNTAPSPNCRWLMDASSKAS